MPLGIDPAYVKCTTPRFKGLLPLLLFKLLIVLEPGPPINHDDAWFPNGTLKKGIRKSWP